MEQYISKSAVVAEIANLQATTMDKDGNFYTAKALAEYNVLCMLESFLDTLEVKEVDLEKEIDDYMNEHFSECGDGVLISDASSTELTLLDATSIARHFFELGLKEQLKNK